MTRKSRKAAHRSQCPVSSALDLLGDKWSLVVVRGLFVGSTRYSDFLKADEGIATNILQDRLESLECAGVLERIEADGVTRYRLTRAGADLLPVLQALARWGFAHIAGRWQPPGWFMKAKPADFYPKD
jgi:DNA-binding HxlR family transcriptional regulator